MKMWHFHDMTSMGLLYIFSTLVILNAVNAVDPVLSPVTVTDQHGNFADAESNVTWAPLPEGKKYTTDTTYHHAGLQGFYNLCRGFLAMVQPNDFPTGKYIPIFYIGFLFIEYYLLFKITFILIMIIHL